MNYKIVNDFLIQIQKETVISNIHYSNLYKNEYGLSFHCKKKIKFFFITYKIEEFDILINKKSIQIKYDNIWEELIEL